MDYIIFRTRKKLNETNQSDTLYYNTLLQYQRCILNGYQARIQKKNEPPQNFLISRFYQMFPRYFTTFPRFFTNKFFEVRKWKRCGSLNPRLDIKRTLSKHKVSLKHLKFNGECIILLYDIFIGDILTISEIVSFPARISIILK